MGVLRILTLVVAAAGPALCLAGPPAERAHPGRPIGKHLALPATVFQEGEPVRLGWFDTPGHAQDWVTVIAAGRPDGEYGPWTYTRGKLEGVFVVEDLPAGDYEARLYLDWPHGGFKVVDRLPFTVVPASGPVTQPARATRMLAVARTVFPGDRPVAVGWHDSPGDPADWITVVPEGTPPDEWGPWRFTGRKAGTFRVGHLEPGRYEARMYFKWPGGGFAIRDRLSFSVR